MEQKWYKLFLLLLAAATVLVPALRASALMALCALTLAGALNAPVSALERRGIRRSWGAAAVLLGIALVLAALLLFGASKGCEGIGEVMDTYDPFTGLGERLRPMLAVLPQGLEELVSRGMESLTWERNLLREKLTAWAAEWAAQGVSRLPGWLLALAVTVLGAYYAVSDWPTVKREVLKAIPRDWRAPAAEGVHHLKDGAMTWLSVQGRLVLIQFVLLAAGLALLRIKGFLVLAVLVALVDALPLLGSGVVLVPWAGFLFLDGAAGRALGLILLWLVLWLCRTTLEPKLMGARVGVSPVWTLLAVYLGVRTLGVLGLIGAPILLSAVAELLRSRKEEG